MSIMKFKAGAKGASGKHASYITRESACESISFHNLDELETEDQYENRVNALSYAHNREEEETNGRSHYRVILSWDREEETEKARKMTHEFLEEKFKDARAVVAVHQDTEHTHTHVWIDARQEDGRKLHSPRGHINDLSKSWQKQYDREYQTNYEKEFEAKREETRQYREARHKGLEAEEPNRARMQSEDYRRKDERDAGVKTNGTEQKGLGRNQRFAEERERISKESERAITTANQQINRTESKAREVSQGIGRMDKGQRRGSINR
jgi:hypothetical protein